MTVPNKINPQPPMTHNQIIESELVNLAKTQKRCLARGDWLEAYAIDIKADYLLRLKQRFAEHDAQVEASAHQMVPP